MKDALREWRRAAIPARTKYSRTSGIEWSTSIRRGLYFQSPRKQPPMTIKVALQEAKHSVCEPRLMAVGFTATAILGGAALRGSVWGDY